MAHDPASQNSQPVPHIRVMAQYAKSAKFSCMEGAQLKPMQNAPNIELGIDLQYSPVGEQPGIFETVLKLMGRAKQDNETLFEVDLAYAGLFDVSGTPAEHQEYVLMIDCPELLFPFARRVIAELSREGGFPPLLVDPIDFRKLYQNQIQSTDGASGA